MTSRALRAAVGASDNLRQLYLELLNSGDDLDAQLAHHCGEIIGAMTGRLVVKSTQSQQPELS